MKKYLFSVCLFTSVFLKAQITITSTNVPASGDTARLSYASVASLTTNTNLTSYFATGANYTWYFDSLKPTGQTLRKFEPASTYGYFSSGFCEKVADTMDLFIAQFTNVCDIYKKNSSNFYMDAWGITYSGFPIPNSYSNKDEIYNFPLDYLDRDSTTFKMATFTSSMIPFGYKKEGYRITEVDGWGTIRTPFGIEACLHVVTTQYSIDSIRATIPVGTFTVPLNIGYPNYVRKYQWLTLSDKVPYLEVTGNVIGTVFTPTEVRYRDRYNNFTGVKEQEQSQLALGIYPNPTTSHVNFIIPNTGVYKIEILDLHGRVVMSEVFENNNLINQNQLELGDLPSGMYSGRIIKSNTVQNFKLIKQ